MVSIPAASPSLSWRAAEAKFNRGKRYKVGTSISSFTLVPKGTASLVRVDPIGFSFL